MGASQSVRKAWPGACGGGLVFETPHVVSYKIAALQVGESVLNAGGLRGDCVLKAWGKHGESQEKAEV